MAARKPREEVHHAAPRCLVSLHERANGSSLDGEGIQAWLEWEMEAMRWRVPIEISREDLEALVDASEVLLERGAHRLVHASGDWGDLDAHDRRQNERALRTGTRLFSAYDTSAGRVWIITEADRSCTTLLLPEEY